MPTEKKPVSKEIQINDSLPTLFIDNASSNHRRDKFSFIRLLTTLPDGNREQARIMISDEHLRGIIDIFCKSINYYPEKSSDIKKGPPQNRK